MAILKQSPQQALQALAQAKESGVSPQALNVFINDARGVGVTDQQIQAALSPPVDGDFTPGTFKGIPKGQDTIPAMLTEGEFVVNAEAAQEFNPILEKINNYGRLKQDLGVPPMESLMNTPQVPQIPQEIPEYPGVISEITKKDRHGAVTTVKFHKPDEVPPVPPMSQGVIPKPTEYKNMGGLVPQYYNTGASPEEVLETLLAGGATRDQLAELGYDVGEVQQAIQGAHIPYGQEFNTTPEIQNIPQPPQGSVAAAAQEAITQTPQGNRVEARGDMYTPVDAMVDDIYTESTSYDPTKPATPYQTEGERPYGSVRARPETSGRNQRAWDLQYKESHNTDGTPKESVAVPEVRPRPLSGHARRAWDTQYGKTHNPDGTPITAPTTEPTQPIDPHTPEGDATGEQEAAAVLEEIDAGEGSAQSASEQAAITLIDTRRTEAEATGGDPNAAEEQTKKELGGFVGAMAKALKSLVGADSFEDMIAKATVLYVGSRLAGNTSAGAFEFASTFMVQQEANRKAKVQERADEAIKLHQKDPTYWDPETYKEFIKTGNPDVLRQRAPYRAHAEGTNEETGETGTIAHNFGNNIRIAQANTAGLREDLTKPSETWYLGEGPGAVSFTVRYVTHPDTGKAIPIANIPGRGDFHLSDLARNFKPENLRKSEEFREYSEAELKKIDDLSSQARGIASDIIKNKTIKPEKHNDYEGYTPNLTPNEIESQWWSILRKSGIDTSDKVAMNAAVRILGPAIRDMIDHEQNTGQPVTDITPFWKRQFIEAWGGKFSKSFEEKHKGEPMLFNPEGGLTGAQQEIQDSYFDTVVAAPFEPKILKTFTPEQLKKLQSYKSKQDKFKYVTSIWKQDFMTFANKSPEKYKKLVDIAEEKGYTPYLYWILIDRFSE